MKAIYIQSQKIVGQNRDVLDFFILGSPIILLDKFRKFLLFSSGIDCADGRGLSDFTKNSASIHFTTFGKDKNSFFAKIIWFSNNEDIFLLNIADKNELLLKEKIFYTKNKKIKEYLDSLKDTYDIHKANKNIFQMGKCISRAEDIVSGKIKVY